MEFRHVSKLSQQNKKNKSNRSKSGGKVESKGRQLMGSRSANLGKDARFNMMNEMRKNKREEMIMKRRGLEFITEHHEENLDQESIAKLETEVDNVAPKVVAILALHDSCDIKALRQQLVNTCIEHEQKVGPKKKMDSEERKELDTQFQSYLCPNPGSNTNMGSKKQRLIFVEINREDPYSVLDVGKVADLVLVAMSCKETNVAGLKVDPDKHANAIDEAGYKALGLLRSQGMGSITGVLQHLETISSKKQPQIRKLFQRYFSSEFTDKYKFMFLNQLNLQNDASALLRQIAVQFPESLSWRQNRSYMMAEVGHLRTDEVHVRGYIRQNFLNVKRLVHITGVHPVAFKIKRIDLADDPCPLKLSHKEKEQVLSTSRAQSIVSSRKSSRRGSFDSNAPMTIDANSKTVQKYAKGNEDQERDSSQIENNPGMFAAEQTWPTEEEMKQAQKQRANSLEEAEEGMDTEMDSALVDQMKKKGGELDNLEDMFDKMQIKVVGREGEASQDDLESDDESDGDLDELANQSFIEDQRISQKHAKHTDLEERAREDMDFPDEVDTPFTEARKRYQKYRGVKTLKNCDWDPYEMLPPEYSKIWRFQNYNSAQKDSIQQTIEEGLPLNGTYVNIVLELEDPEHAKNFSMGQALIVSTLFPHETKLSTMHFKLKRTIENKDIVPSKTVTEFHCGFRRMELKPIFSAETNPGSGSEKYRFMRFMRTDCSVVATAYCPIVFTPSKVLCFNRKVDEETGQLLPIGEVLATGVVMPPNPLRIILKRIILTGYPMKAHKKKAVVRYMFFDPKDIKYFKPVELCTKHGLRGHIKQSLGTHGLMKCAFNDFIKNSDTVMLHLFRRVYPVWYEKTWNPNAIEQIKPKHEKFDKEEDQEMQ